jgi:N-acetyl-anhydromuramyl-L-alanine amidase AmpD
MRIIDIPSTHKGGRRVVTGVTLHAIGEWLVDDGDAAGGGVGRIYHCTDWLRATGVSTHVFALPDGRGVREVDSWEKAWHCKGFNTSTVGIEFVLAGVWPYGEFIEAMKGTRNATYTDEQIAFGVEWCQARSREHGFELTAETVRTHAQRDPDRKRDPGIIFDYPGFIASL